MRPLRSLALTLAYAALLLAALAPAFAQESVTSAIQRVVRTAKEGNAPAQFELALMYARGETFERDYSEACKWLQAAAEQGHAAAQSQLGWMYAQGRGVTQDFRQAMKWYRLAAAQTDSRGQFGIAQLYARGEGVAADPNEAARWYRRAGVGADPAKIALAAKVNDGLLDSRLQFGSFNHKKPPPVVKVSGRGDSRGTGFLGKNCTVWTNLHVLEPGMAVDPRFLINQPNPQDRTLIGSVFTYDTLETPGHPSLKGKFRVIAHGDINNSDPTSDLANDFAVGIDPDCLSQSEDLGYFGINSRSEYSDIDGLPFYQAGFPYNAGTPFDQATLVVDPNCTLVSDAGPLWFTNCYSDKGGSGSPMFSELDMVRIRRADQDTTNNRFIAYGLHVAGKIAPDGRSEALLFEHLTIMIPFAGIIKKRPELREVLGIQ